MRTTSLFIRICLRWFLCFSDINICLVPLWKLQLLSNDDNVIVVMVNDKVRPAVVDGEASSGGEKLKITRRANWKSEELVQLFMKSLQLFIKSFNACGKGNITSANIQVFYFLLSEGNGYNYQLIISLLVFYISILNLCLNVFWICFSFIKTLLILNEIYVCFIKRARH